MLSLKPDFEKTMERFEAFWQHRVLDRPVVQFLLAKPPAEQGPLPESRHASPAERWMDARYQAGLTLATLSNQLFPGDTLPVAWPNLGPDIFAALYGCPLEFGDYGTSWAAPILKDWSRAGSLRLDWDGPYLKKLDEMTGALLETGNGIFITGMTDWHPGGDCLAALRGPQALALDLVERPDEVKDLLGRIEQDYFKVYEHFYRVLRRAGQPITAWINLACTCRFYIPSNDFSGMISQRMFAEFFLPGIRRECQFLEHSIYHLDGPGAVRHLELLLDIPELDAIQFVPTPGDEAFGRWATLYRRIQQGGKGVHFTCDFSEIGEVMEALRPEGLFLQVKNAPSLEAAEWVLKSMEEWSLRGRRPDRF
jgi:hypothetical protein